jgi:hypothetical protein
MVTRAQKRQTRIARIARKDLLPRRNDAIESQAQVDGPTINEPEHASGVSGMLPSKSHWVRPKASWPIQPKKIGSFARAELPIFVPR